MASKTREKLIEVARQLFANKGITATTMNDIAAASAKGRRTIYTYFRNKREIYDAVIEQESERMMDKLRTATALAKNPAERLRAFLGERLGRLTEPHAFSLFSRLRPENRRTEKIQKLVQQKEYDMLSQILADGCADSVFRPDRCKQILAFIPMLPAVIDYQTFSTDELKQREDALNVFIDFIITDISISAAEKA